MIPTPIVPVILSGGSGTRLWPVSRSAEPKQLLAMVDDRTMLRATIDRLDGLADVNDPIVVCSQLHQHLVARELQGAGFDAPRIILEPIGRNTAPAVAAAAVTEAAADADPVLLILPADHVIKDEASFREAVAAGVAQAVAGNLVTFGIVPEYAETGYGYVHRGAKVADDAYAVAAFVEKPDAATAARYVESGDYLWNSGMFMFRASRYLEELAKYRPDILAATTAAVESGRRNGGLHLDPAAFDACPSESIDYAVMERTEEAVVVPLSAGWNDVGSWAALWGVADKDAAGNVIHGDVIAVDAAGSYLRAESRLLAAIGVSDLVIVETPDAVLVAPRSQVQDVRLVVDELKEAQRPETTTPAKSNEPWGQQHLLEAGPAGTVRRLSLAPGSELALQPSGARAEEWVVMAGTATVGNGDDGHRVGAGEHLSLATDVVHRIANTGSAELEIIAVTVD
jgi:mannose-1-phosphate guanylyltransferase/mannose-6-phosphate isomerase